MNSDSIKYSFSYSCWSYSNEINNFISWCYDKEVVLRYASIEERDELLVKDISDMTKEDIRKYLYVLNSVERCYGGMIKKNQSK